MKIAILGSAPSSIKLAPFGDTSWKIWACSPGAYPVLTRVDEFWELHRWEPGKVGKPETQKPWFSPEYVQWLKTVPPKLWVADPAAAKDCPNAELFPIESYVNVFGHYCWTSSVAYMLARAIIEIEQARAKRQPGDQEEDCIGLWGVDMAANEELYSAQRSACQFFLQIIAGRGIPMFVPPESDLMTPPPMYGFAEVKHKHIKWLERKRELEARLAAVNAQAEMMRNNSMFLQGAIDDMQYHQTMWMHDGEDTVAFQFEAIFPEIIMGREAQSAKVKSLEQAPVAATAEEPAPVAARPQPIPVDIEIQGIRKVVDPVGDLDAPRSVHITTTTTDPHIGPADLGIR